MSVYVDPLFTMEARGAQAHRVGARNGHRWCHMFTDGPLDELHALAQRIGMRREWFQEHASRPHYDLTPSRRAAAVRLGAVEVTRRAAVALWKWSRQQERGES